MRKKSQIPLVVLAVLVGILAMVCLAGDGVLAAGSSQTKLRGLYAKTMGDRETPIPCFGRSPTVASAMSKLATYRMDKTALLKRTELLVARRRGTSGNTTCVLQVNGTTVVGSTVSVAYYTGANYQAGRTTADLYQQLEVGDVVSVRISAVTGGTASQAITCTPNIVERY